MWTMLEDIMKKFMKIGKIVKLKGWSRAIKGWSYKEDIHGIQHIQQRCIKGLCSWHSQIKYTVRYISSRHFMHCVWFWLFRCITVFSYIYAYLFWYYFEYIYTWYIYMWVYICQKYLISIFDHILVYICLKITDNYF